MSATSNNIISLRRHDLDNLRTFLTGLVVVHHTAVAYGAPGSAPFTSAISRLAFPGARVPLTACAALDQSFFMGLFFWISGRMSAQSLERADADPSRTRWSFVRNKLLRLGSVAVVYTFVVQPVISLIPLREWTYTSVSERLVQYFSTMRSVRGPVWYTATLLVMDTITALVAPRVDSTAAAEKTEETTATATARKHQGPPAWYVRLAKYGWIGVAALSFAVRLYYPLGTNFKIIALQPAHATQYVFAYAMGHASWKYDTLFMGLFDGAHPGDAVAESSPTRQERNSSAKSVAAAALVSLATLPIVSLPFLFRSAAKGWIAQTMTDVAGGWNYSAALYAFWNEFAFILICPALVRYFAAWHNRPSQSGLFQARYSYGTFLLHMLVSIPQQVAVDWFLGYSESERVETASWLWGWLSPSVMTVMVGAVNVYSSFGAAKLLLDAFPALRRII